MQDMKRRYFWGIVWGIGLWAVYAILLMMHTRAVILRFGSEVNSIWQSAQNIFNYFVLFESGMGSAYLFKMFQPMAKKDMEKVGNLYSGLTCSMKRIAGKMALALIAVAFLYAVIIDKQETGYVTAVWIIFLLGMRFIIPYYVCVNKKTLLMLYDYKYLVEITDSLGKILIVLIELYLFYRTDISIVYILSLGCVLTALMGAVYECMIRRFCRGISFRKGKPDLEAEKMTKDILLHQLTGLINTNVDTILLSITDIQSVTVYQAYAMLYSYPGQMINKISDTFRANFGIRMAKGDKNLYRSFQKLLSMHMFAAIVCIAVFVTDSNAFVRLWLGEQFVISPLCVCLFALYMVVKMNINVIFLVRDGQGLYKESKTFSIWEAVFNAGLSVVLVKPFGIAGVMAATVIAIYCGLVPGNARLVYHDIFGKKNLIYLDYSVVIGTIALSVAAYHLLFGKCAIGGWLDLFLSVVRQVALAFGFAVVVILICKGKYLRKKQ